MIDIKCKYCNSENVYYSKKKNQYVCEDCEKSFDLKHEFIPQKIFLSYGHDQNTEVVNIIYDALKERGHFPWIDYSNIKTGDDWRNNITKGILESNDFLAFVSNHSVRVPGVCLDEISIGVGNYNCRIKPILLEKGVVAPNCIRNIQYLDMTDWMTIKNTQPESVWNKWITEKINTIINMVEDENNSVLSGNITWLDNKLQPITNILKLRILLKEKILPRNWLINLVNQNITNDIFVIYGGPGSGKSTLSAYLSNFSSSCVASYFCEWDNDSTKNVGNMVKSIIFQLACGLDDYQAYIVNYLKSHNMDILNETSAIEQLILLPLNMLIEGNRDKKYIIIDALDEVGVDNNTFFNSVIKIGRGLPRWISLVITARAERKLMELFQDYSNINIDNYRENIYSDLFEYINHDIAEVSEATEIVARCAGSFLYAKEFVRLYSKDEVNVNILPQGINGIYYSYFERAFSDYGIYKSVYRPIFDLIFSAKEQLTVKEVGEILGFEEDELLELLQNVNNYICVIKNQDESYFQVFHKSFAEWINSSGAGKYKIDKKKGDKVLREYLVKCSDSDVSLSKYLVKYGIDHFGKIEWLDLDSNTKCGILKKMVEYSSDYGFLPEEQRYLVEIEKVVGHNYLYYYYALEYYKKISGEKLLEIAKNAKEFIETLDDEQQQFDITCQIAFSYFYAGYAEKSFDYIVNERKKHKAEFWMNDMNEANYWHVVAVSAHDLDNNIEVIKAAKKDIVEYGKKHKYYDQFISYINLFDGYMALGMLGNADEVCTTVSELLNEKYFIHVDDIFNICKANLLQTEGRIMESLVYYEEGLKIAKDIQSWDYIYGSIWRELAIAKFGDYSCFGALEKYKEMAQEAGYNYLVSLADCFAIIASHLLGCSEFNYKLYYDEICNIGMPGHILQASICCMLDGIEQVDIRLVIDKLKICEGVKGEPLLILSFYNKFSGVMNKEEKDAFNDWIDNYVVPIVEYGKRIVDERTKDLENNPFLCSYNCKECQSKCCYDGVYLEKGEEEKIKEFVEDNPEFFQYVVSPYIVDGDWPGMRSQRKIEKKEYSQYDDKFPKHFTRTRCVFALESGECGLQRLSTDLQMHPWKFKPRACWSFPIRGVLNGKILAPVSSEDKDPDYVDEGYPGYATFLPCSKADDKGTVWYEKYRNEVEYYSYLIREELL